jgi:ABC-2 type transport system permease protein
VTRVWALGAKELAELRRSPAAWLPPLLTSTIPLAIPLVIAVGVPALTGEALADSREFADAATGAWPGLTALGPEGAIQAWLFSQFVVLLLLSPIGGSMTLAAFSVIGEKQARTLEPLLATPITTAELLAAKTLGALLPAMALSALGFLTYVGLIAALAEPGVAAAVAGPRSLTLVFVLGPLAGLAALLLAVTASSRVNDARSAQQVGVLVILPVVGLFIVQLRGDLALTTSAVLAVAAVLALVDLALLALAVSVFQRESILTRWK